jgi:hypothetical protein
VRAFDLGTGTAPPVRLAGGSSAERWLLTTDRGRWMVKVTAAPQEWERHQMRVSGVLERAAYRTGVPMPEPVAPRGAAIGYWAPAGESGKWTRVTRWVDGAPPGSADPALAAWLGRTVAAIERLDLPADPTADAAYPLHPVPDWRHWLDEAVPAGVLDGRQARILASAVRDATALMEAALAEARPAFRLAHRDVNRRNILVTAPGPVLLDFDYAGPEVPWWELVHHAFDLASPRLGHEAPRADLVRAAVAAHQDAGGTPGPASPDAFAGLVHAVLNATAYHLWLALGHRAAAPERRSQAAALVRDQATALPAIVSSVEEWCRLLG